MHRIELLIGLGFIYTLTAFSCFSLASTCIEAVETLEGLTKFRDKDSALSYATSQRLLALLEEPLPPPVIMNAKRDSDLLQRRAEKIATQLETSPRATEARREIDLQRQQTSNTLMRAQSREREAEREAIKRWSDADRQVTEWVKQGVAPTAEHLLQLQSIIEGTPPGARTGTVESESVHPQDLAKFVADFDEWYRKNQNQMPPVALAALSGQRWLTAHPSMNGNGRTGRLLVDWVLQLNKLPPATYELGDDTIMIRSTTNTRDVTPQRAVELVSRAVERSLNTLEEHLAEKADFAPANLIRKSAGGYQVLVRLGDFFRVETVSDLATAEAVAKKNTRPIDFEVLAQEAGKVKDHWQKELEAIKKSAGPGVNLEVKVKSPSEIREALFETAALKLTPFLNVTQNSVEFYFSIPSEEVGKQLTERFRRDARFWDFTGKNEFLPTEYKTWFAKDDPPPYHGFVRQIRLRGGIADQPILITIRENPKVWNAFNPWRAARLKQARSMSSMLFGKRDKIFNFIEATQRYLIARGDQSLSNDVLPPNPADYNLSPSDAFVIPK